MIRILVFVFTNVHSKNNHQIIPLNGLSIMSSHLKRLILSLLVFGFLFFTNSCGNSKPGNTPETVAEAEEQLAKNRKKEAKAAKKEAKATHKRYWAMQTKAAKKSIKKNKKRMKKNQKKQGRFVP